MTLAVALPVAHRTATTDFAAYYPSGRCVFQVTGLFGQTSSQIGQDPVEGLGLRADPTAASVLADSLWDLHALVHGFLSLHGDKHLVLRLPRELAGATGTTYNSGRQFLGLRPGGPALRQVVHAFASAPGAAVEDAVRTILADATHPGRTITRVSTATGTATLGTYLTGPGNLVDGIVAEFMAGRLQLFVRAGDVIGNFRDHPVDLRFLDSCGSGSKSVTVGTPGPAVPTGRATNPAYYLGWITHPANATHVTMLSQVVSTPGGTAHPLHHLLTAPAVTALGGQPHHVFDPTATTPSPPRLLTIPVRDTAGNTLAGRGIPIGPLGEWHESRNAANPYSTKSPTRWRFYGGMAGDVAVGLRCVFRSEVKPGAAPRMPLQSGLAAPNAGPYDHDYPATTALRDKVRIYWDRYAVMINEVADAFEIPCELLVTTACKETGGGSWFNATNPAASHEPDVIRMEPLKGAVATITGNGADQARLTDYEVLAGNVSGVPHRRGANATIPVPWSGATRVAPGNPLTWADLRVVVDRFPDAVRVSPGITQTLVSTADVDLAWLATVYGAAAVTGRGVVVGGVTVTPLAPPAGLGDLFADWFGVAVDAGGAATTVAANIDGPRTRATRALHGLIAGAAHIRRVYNSVRGSSNLVCDYDLPTVASGYNDGANPKSATANDNQADKGMRVFGLTYYGLEYPRDGTRLYNAAVAYFNALPAGQPQPTVRLWVPP